jgi:hypothetical protein
MRFNNSCMGQLLNQSRHSRDAHRCRAKPDQWEERTPNEPQATWQVYVHPLPCTPEMSDYFAVNSGQLRWV